MRRDPPRLDGARLEDDRSAGAMFGASSAERMEQMERARKYLADVQGDEPLVPERNAEDRPIDASTSAEQIMRAALGRYAENQVDGARERLMRSGYYREALAVRKKLQAQTARNRCARFFLYVLVVALVVLAFLLASMYVRDDGKREVDISATVTAMQYHPKTLALKSLAEQLHHRTKRTFGALVQTSSDPRALVHLRRGRSRRVLARADQVRPGHLRPWHRHMRSCAGA